MDQEAKTAGTGHTIPVLRKAIRLIEAVAQNPREATTKSLAVTLNIAPSTCYRILQSFVAEGWLQRRSGGLFELSPQLSPIFRSLWHREQLVEAVHEPLAGLVHKCGLTAKITVRQGDNAVTIHTANSTKADAIASRVGLAVSLAIGSSGATFLAACTDEEVHHVLDAAPANVWRHQNRADVLRRVREARRHGVCVDRGSFQSDVHSLSAPICNSSGKVVAVVTLIGSAAGFSASATADLAGKLKDSVRGCTQRILDQCGLIAA